MNSKVNLIIEFSIRIIQWVSISNYRQNPEKSILHEDTLLLTIGPDGWGSLLFGDPTLCQKLFTWRIYGQLIGLV